MRDHMYAYRKPGRVRNIVLVTLAVALGTAAVGVALYIAVQAWSAAGALAVQNRQLQRQVASLSGQVTGLKSKERADYVSVGSMLAPVLPLAQTVCSQDLTGPTGPAEYWFPCTAQKPSQSSTG